MKRWCLYLLFITNTAFAAGCDLVDDLGGVVRLQKPAQRIVSLAPHLTELLFSIGAGSSIVGVISASDYPPAATHLPIIGTYSKLDLEKIIALHPDLIVMWGNGYIQQSLKLQKWGIPIFRNDPHRLEDIPRTLRVLGCLTGHEGEARRLAKQFIERLHALKQIYQHRKPIKVFYQINAHPLMTINHQSWIDQAIQLCGGVNIYHDAILAAPEVSWESIVIRNPDMVMMDGNRASWRLAWQKWPQIAAVKQNAIHVVNADFIERASLRLLLGIKVMCEQIDSSRSRA